MRIKLNKPLIILDLESTGLDVSKDRIIEIGMVKLHPDGKKEEYIKRVNPEMPVSKEASEITGITDEMLKDEKKFEELAHEVAAFIGNSDIGGYNSNKFDLPLLAEEFLRTSVEFDIRKRNFIDIQNIFHKMEQRTLEAAYKFYCGEEMTNGHNAAYDAKVTLEVFEAQLERYQNIGNNIEELAIFTRYGNNEIADFAGRLAFNKEGKVIYNFGKHKGKTMSEVDKIEPGYYGWMLDADFPLYTKQVLKEEREKLKAKRNENKETIDNSSMEDKLNALANKFKK